ncbi:MAG: hypothetical protein IJW57_09115 [Spirochaetaceae bacterium]|nr:hypothetical protein [Spirochaetaceae bacterium]
MYNEFREENCNDYKVKQTVAGAGWRTAGGQAKKYPTRQGNRQVGQVVRSRPR